MNSNQYVMLEFYFNKSLTKYRIININLKIAIMNKLIIILLAKK